MVATAYATAYDKNGNTVGEAGWARGKGFTRAEMWYDSFDRMLGWRKVKGFGRRARALGIETHTYAGAEWRRVSTTADSGDTTHFVYDGDNVVADYTDGALAREYVTPFLDQNVAVYTVAGETVTPYYYTQDGLGSVRTLTDASGTTKNSYDYEAFGSAYSPNTTSTVEQRYTYTGREHSNTSGLNYHRYRWDDPAIGRWPTRDPIGYRGGVNLYGYVSNKPNIRRDIFGLKWDYAPTQASSSCGTFYVRDRKLVNFQIFKVATTSPIRLTLVGLVARVNVIRVLLYGLYKQ